jgi:hypothetical protein
MSTVLMVVILAPLTLALLLGARHSRQPLRIEFPQESQAGTEG